MKARIASILLGFFIIISFIDSKAGGIESTYSQLSFDKTIIGTTPVTVLTTTINLSSSQDVLVVADGRYFPVLVDGTAVMTIQIDGSDAHSNDSLIDFKYTSNPVQHSFNCIAATTLSSGTHTIKLVGYNHTQTPTARFIVGSNSSLAVLTDPAPNMVVSSLSLDSANISFVTQGIGPTGPVPTATILSNFVPVGGQTSKVVTLASGRSYRTCPTCLGDALWGIFLDNEACQSNDEATWTVNDLATGAELHAPMYAHALHEIVGSHTLKLEAGELSFPTFENQVQYRIGARSRLISLWGMDIAGSGVASTQNCDRADWVCIGSSIGNPGCPPAGQWTEIADDTFVLPSGHNGVVLFMAKTRVQGDPSDLGGNMALRIELDGQFVGSSGIQQLKTPDSVSSRTVTASYLAAGSDRLSTGSHTVKVFARIASGSFKHLVVSQDLPLVYID